jgi:hypothetical protein
MAVSSEFLVLRYLLHFLAKSLIWDGEIHCEHLLGHLLSLFCIGGLRLQFSVRAVYG